MSVAACAALVERGDPDRFLATMAAPVPARAVLFPIYAFNVEVARAPWVSEEPLIAQMRLQWWADTLDEIEAGGAVRRHEVAVPLSEVLDAGGARLLQPGIAARQRDARREPPEDVAALTHYLDDTAGRLIWAASRALEPGLGPEAEARAMALGRMTGLANYLLGVPDFLARGVNPLPAMTDAEFAGLLGGALAGARRQVRPGRAQRIVELSAWRAVGVLRRALRDPAAVPEGRLQGAPFARQGGLLLRSLRV